MRTAAAIRAYKRRAIIKAGWTYDEGGPHWFRPSDHPFSFPGSYARTVDAAFAEAGLEMNQASDHAALIADLWKFIDDTAEDDPTRQDKFFDLRARVRSVASKGN